jgi:hypothetical protein
MADLSASAHDRGIIAGVLVFAIALALALPPSGVPNSGAYLFLFVGIAFLLAYARKRGDGWPYLLPGCVFTAFGLGLLAPTWFPAVDPKLGGPILLGTQSVALTISFLVKPDHWGPLVPAVVLATIAAADAFLHAPIVPDTWQPYFLPAMLVGLAVHLLYRELTFGER